MFILWVYYKCSFDCCALHNIYKYRVIGFVKFYFLVLSKRVLQKCNNYSRKIAVSVYRFVKVFHCDLHFICITSTF